MADFGHVPVLGLQENYDLDVDQAALLPNAANVRQIADLHHHDAGNLALLMVALGILFAVLLYYARALDPAEAKEQFPGVHSFLSHKWYFDELYSAAVVRPSLVVAHWFKWFDLKVIDGIIHGAAWLVLKIERVIGGIDKGVVDGLVNLSASVFWGIGTSFRKVQTGSLRSYVLFLALAAVAIYAALSYFVGLAPAR